MKETSIQQIPYRQTNYFSSIVLDYISANEKLYPFYMHPFSVEGIKAAIEERKKYLTDRKVLVAELEKQYNHIGTDEKVKANIQKLKAANTFTVTTAHQPNIFTGHLYFIYKILHAIKLAEYLQQALPENNFVPFFYMGSEDADLDELGQINIGGEQYQWQTNQTGAVGRMKVDKPLLKLIDQFSGQLTTHAFGTVIIELLKSCYKEDDTIERSTFKIINELFKAYGLVVLLPDNSALKKLLTPVASKELIENFSHKAVDATVKNFPPEYKVQAAGRDINLFYLKDNSRERITLDKSLYKVQNTNLAFTEKELLADLENNPEQFSPNVILRPVFQEMILPNVAFIGGGGELAYWLELKKVFEESNVPLPVMVLRNSFLVIDKAAQELMQKLKLTVNDVFENETALINSIVKRQTDKQLSLDKEKESLAAVYKQIEEASGKIDATLTAHTQNLYTKALKKIEALEKKMLKAEKKKFDAQQRQVSKLKSMLFPNGHLQEREENLLPWYAKHGKAFIQTIYENSLRLEQEFAVVLL